MEPEKKPEQKPQPTSEPKNPIERAEEVVKTMKEMDNALQEKITKLEKLQATELLSGTAGIRPNIEPSKELSAKDYKDYIEKHGKPPQ